ncbi:FAD-dependent thymidylate synthase [Picrophilus oshimae]|uniref:Thy1 protein n=1 Tax=Picrophilus torridus (strain ATCC 700027 / DSM 9790 / JCM 10055 / NBRC 100828 / KAW 2/3) TaxID=1122961 RepID=Q6L131_PICTO|nr:FAD-dependent thymidylate synthase [Picrophilus oshimae]AAT43321.1 Thy1 protein [Picrophilus oshimae DSM 9789]
MDFSNYDRDVFLIKTDKMIDRGALMSRYSRTASLDIRDLYKKEFNDPERAGDFYRRIFIEYGDESISELVTAQMGIQNISNIASKIIEEQRIGLSYLEKSSRYVRYDKKTSDGYLYLKPDRAGIGYKSNEYENICNSLFDFYSSIYNEMLDYFKEKYPVESFTFEIGDSYYKYSDINNLDDNIINKSYKSALRAAVLDEIRYVLPASTLTNLGISGNGRAFISMIQRLYRYNLQETKGLAESIYNELRPEMPGLIDDAFSKHGYESIEYKKCRYPVDLYKRYSDLNEVSLISYNSEDEEIKKASRLMMYNSSGSYDSIEYNDLIDDLYIKRKNRRDKLGRAFESINYLFEVNTNYGAFRELQRHRFLSIIRKPLSVYYNYDIPENISEVESIKKDYISLMDEARDVYNKILESNGYLIAQYVVPFAYKYPVVFSANLNELAYMIELRTTPQAHPDLRRISIKMYNELKRVHPRLSKLIKFVDVNDYHLGRLPSEFKKEIKRNDVR